MNKNSDVQNGTNIVDGKGVGIVATVKTDSKINVTVYMSERDKFKAEFNSWSKKTAQATLEMCRVVYEAKKELGSQDFLKFCNEIGRKGEDATVRKYLRIGEKYDKFYQYADLLPNSWTSIYEITQLPSELFEALIVTENSMANMTGEQIKKLMGKGAEDKSKSSASTAAVASTAQTAQNTSEASENLEAASSKTEVSSTATASSDLSQCDSDAATDHAEAAIDETASNANREFAKQATNTMLERVASTASTTVEVEAEEDFVPYEITIRFNSKPTDAAVAELVESLLAIKSKHRLDFEFVQENAMIE